MNPSENCHFAFITSEALPNGTADDALLKDALEKAGHRVTYAVWNDDAVNWRGFDRALLRSPWDYYKNLSEFIKRIEEIGSQTRLVNSNPIVAWNASKEYLLELQKKNISVIPSHATGNRDDAVCIARSLLTQGRTVVLKPAVSATSYLTFKVNKDEDIVPAVEQILRHGQVIIQPYVKSVAEDGEISLIYFRVDGEYRFSHAVLKTPKVGDFRVQTEFGGEVLPANASPHLIALGLQALNELPDKVAYGRVDIVDWGSQPKIGEVELIEPDLFFRCAGDSAELMVSALTSN